MCACSRLIVGGVGVLFGIAATIEPLLRGGGYVCACSRLTMIVVSWLIVGGAGVLFGIVATIEPLLRGGGFTAHVGVLFGIVATIEPLLLPLGWYSVSMSLIMLGINQLL